MLKKSLLILLILALVSGGLTLLFPHKAAIVMEYLTLKTSDKFTVDERLAQFGEAAAQRLSVPFQHAGIAFPPSSITLLAFKDSKQLELYAADSTGAWKPIKTYPIQATSGLLGPKLREGDRQVPEGIYRIESLNPNSRFHVSLRLNYPNEFDRAMGLADGRDQLGSDIMIHGKAKSIGCLAMGDSAAEELFALAAWVGKENLRVVIAPTDSRQAGAQLPTASAPAWTATLYTQLQMELAQYAVSGAPQR